MRSIQLNPARVWGKHPRKLLDKANLLSITDRRTSSLSKDKKRQLHKRKYLLLCALNAFNGEETDLQLATGHKQRVKGARLQELPSVSFWVFYPSVPLYLTPPGRGQAASDTAWECRTGKVQVRQQLLREMPPAPTPGPKVFRATNWPQTRGLRTLCASWLTPPGPWQAEQRVWAWHLDDRSEN